MKKRYALELGILGMVVLALTLFAPSASAGVAGELSFTNCGGGGVNVTLTAVDWLPVGGGTGCITAGVVTTVTFTGAPGAISLNETGTVNDLSAGSGNSKFIQFAGVYFDAPLIGPGVANTTCAATYNSALPACSVQAGSPFILSASTTGTIIQLAVSGLAYDSTGIGAPWSGVFSTQIAGKTPYQIAQTELKGGTVSATFSFDGVVVPEPFSMALLGGGLIALAGLKRRRA